MTKMIWNVLLALLFILQSCSQTPPKMVNDAFTEKYPEAQGIVWQKGPQDIWMADFYFKRFHYLKAYYNDFGEFMALEVKIYDKEIPKTLKAKIHEKYPNSIIFDVFELKTGQTLVYIIEIEDKGKLFGLRFHENNLLRIIPPNDYRFTSRISVTND